MFTLALRDGLRGVHNLRKNLGKYSWVYSKVIKSIETLMNAEILKIATIDWGILKLSAEIGERYHLLTNDALIAATCIME